MSDLGQILDIAQKITITGGLLLVIWGGVRKVWVWGWLYLKSSEDYEARLAAKDKEILEWQQRALDQMALTKGTVESLQKLIDQASNPALESTPKGGPVT